MGTTNVTLVKGLFMIFRVPIALQVANTIVEVSELCLPTRIDF
jgi:hypothetical protein